MKNVCIAAGILLLLAMLTLPYSYYPFLRWVIFLISIYTAHSFYSNKLPAWALIFGAVAFLFNPLLPVYLSKASWIPLDFICSILFFIAGYSQKYKR